MRFRGHAQSATTNRKGRHLERANRALFCLTFCLTVLPVAGAQAQADEATVPSEPTATPQPSEPAPMPIAVDATPALAAPPEPEPEVVEDKKFAPSLKIGLGVRTGLDLSVNNPSDDVTLSLHDGLANQFTVRPYFSGSLNEHVGVTANFEALPFSIHVMDFTSRPMIARPFAGLSITTAGTSRSRCRVIRSTRTHAIGASRSGAWWPGA
jgi:hypothetical protein